MKTEFENSDGRLSFLCCLTDIKVTWINPWFKNYFRVMKIFWFFSAFSSWHNICSWNDKTRWKRLFKIQILWIKGKSRVMGPWICQVSALVFVSIITDIRDDITKVPFSTFLPRSVYFINIREVLSTDSFYLFPHKTLQAQFF